ncbi:protein of unknown function [Ralstonia solanacearum CMR15]|nr:protein of unknown function [Ralstonia solanacearum CMR15]
MPSDRRRNPLVQGAIAPTEAMT